MSCIDPFSEYHCPKSEDDLFNVFSTFSSDIRWQNQSHTGEFGYIQGYKLSADILVDHLYREDARWNKDEHDLLVFPILFMYRHVIELQLKSLIKIGYKLDSSVYPETEMNCHDLKVLWDKFSHYIDRLYPQEKKEESFNSVQKTIKQLDKMDPKGYCFRYNKDKKGDDVSFNGINSLDLVNIKRIMEGVYEWLSSGIDMFEDTLKHKQDLESN